MKESGINYFFTKLELDTGSFSIMYLFEEGSGTNINSVSGAYSGFSGTLSNSSNFWTKPGSGFFSGNTITINNASGLNSTNWTKIFIFEKINTNDCILYDSLSGSSGYRIGITKTNKPYFESFNQEPIIATSSNNYSSKNLLAVSYLTNFVTFGLYNFNSQKLETESFNYPFEINNSYNCKLGNNITGYIDLFIYYNSYLSPQVIGQWCSGVYVRKTGTAYETYTICNTGITGYQEITFIETGITGYSINPSGDEGRDYFTGAFPLNYNEVQLTGIISSGIIYSGVIGTNCEIITGSQIDSLEFLTGYASSFNMEKIQIFDYICLSDKVKLSYDYTPFNDIYNKFGIRNYSGYLLSEQYDTGFIDLFYNGVGQSNFGWITTGDFIIISGAIYNDLAFFDIKSGNKLVFQVTGGLTGYSFNYSGQEIYLNGVNLISGEDFVLNNGIVNITNLNTGITGYIFEYPIVLNFQTGNTGMKILQGFQRNTSNIYLNGIRQPNKLAYIESAKFDLLSGTYFNYSGVESIYDNTDLYWE